MLALCSWRQLSRARGVTQATHRRLSRAHCRAQPARTTMSAAGGNSNANGAGSSGAGDETVTFLPDGSLTRRTKLSIVVKDALRRWYLETEKEAYRGDVKAQALLGQMLIEGYGCKADPDKGREWVDKARRRGYRMQGVYCEI